MKALVVGCGSIGKRHIANLLESDCVEKVLVYTGVQSCLDDFNAGDRVVFSTSLSGNDVDFAIIANETYKHIETAMLLAEEGIHLLIEKPLSHEMKGLDLLRKLAERKRIKVLIAYNMRFLGALRYIREQLSKDTIGDLYFSKIEVGQYLPSWRPSRDYSKSYSSSKEKGGGVSLDLSHEIDYMRYLFGDPCYWRVIKSKVSDLDIDSEDLFEGLFKYESGLICNVHLDYLQKGKKREISIYGSKGSLVCDFINRKISLQKAGSEVEGQGSGTSIQAEDMFDVDKSYRDELAHFIEIIREDKSSDITIEDGIQVLRLLEDGNV